MKAHKTTTALKLPFQFDEELLVSELKQLLKTNWVAHFNQNGYTGTWNSIALYAVDGDSNNIIPFQHSEAPITATPILKNCEYLKKVIATFKSPLLSVRLLRLSPGGFIKPHRDFESGYEDNFFRLHIPITTNPNVTFTLDDQNLEMRPGECWYTNVNFVHSVSNEGNEDRIHLVIDGQRNHWSDKLFFSLVPKESLLTHQVQEHDSETIKKIIKELELNDSEAVKPLIKKLKAQLKKPSISQ